MWRLRAQDRGETGCKHKGSIRACRRNCCVAHDRGYAEETSGRCEYSVAGAGPGGKKRKWSRSGDPIDTTKFDLAVTTAEKALKSKPEDAGAKKALAKAFVERGIALTSARQYAAAIGDYRRALKYDPSDAEAKQQIGTITAIYNSMNIESPGVGEEPAPLEFKKEKD